MKSKIELIWTKSLGSGKLSLKNCDDMYIVILDIFNEFHGQQKQKKSNSFLTNMFLQSVPCPAKFFGYRF